MNKITNIFSKLKKANDEENKEVPSQAIAEETPSADVKEEASPEVENKEEVPATEEPAEEEKELSEKETAELEKMQKEAEKEKAKAKKEKIKAEKKEQKEKDLADNEGKWQDFLSDYPTIGKALSDPRVSKGKKIAIVGEIVASLAGATARGMNGDFTQHQGYNQSIINKAFDESMKRKNERLESANKADIDYQDRFSIINKFDSLKGLDEASQRLIANNLPVEKMSEEEFNERILKDSNYTPEEKANLYKDYITAKDSYDEYLNKAGKRIELSKSEIDLGKVQEELKRLKRENKIANKKDWADYIAVLNERINQVDKDIKELQKSKVTDVTDLFNSYMSRYKGYDTATSTENSNKNVNANVNAKASAKGGIKGFGAVEGSVDAGLGTSSGNQEGYTYVTDMAAGRFGTAQKYVDDTSGDIDKARNTMIADMQNYRTALINMRDAAKAEMNKSVDDGIIKSDGQPQKLVKADGTEIILNPDDNVYATKKEIVTDKDNGEEIIPLEENDEVTVLQKELGWNGEAINKNVDDYINMLEEIIL